MPLCLVCDETRDDLRQHIKLAHRVNNARELSILLQLCAARYSGRLDCPVCDKRNLCRLDMHLKRTHVMDGEDVHEVLIDAKRGAILGLLAQLRSQDPYPPMVTTLDLQLRAPRPPSPPGEVPAPPSEEECRADVPAPRSETEEFTEEFPPPPRSESEAITEECPAPRWGDEESPGEGPAPPLSPACSSGHECSFRALPGRRPRGVRRSWSSLKGRSPRESRRFSRSTLRTMLDDFESYFLVSEPTGKDRENAHLRRSHVVRFLKHMLHGHEDRSYRDLSFACHFSKLRDWPKVLRSQSYTPTSIKNMLGNVSVFIRHVRAFFSDACGITQVQAEQISLVLKRMQKDNGRMIRSHQQSVKRSKSKMLRSSREFELFMSKAECQIPLLLARATAVNRPRKYTLLQGYIAGYLCMLTGHRPVVFCNLTKAQLRQAEVDNRNRTLVWVSKHKTDRAFGNAFMALTSMETSWLRDLARLSSAYGGQRCEYVFQSNGQQVRKLVGYLRDAWRHAGMVGLISFNLIRTSVCNQVRHNLTAEERKLVSDSMCHDTGTADRFYVATPELRDAFQIRELRMKALEQDQSSSSSSSSSTSDSGSSSP